MDSFRELEALLNVEGLLVLLGSLPDIGRPRGVPTDIIMGSPADRDSFD